MSSWLRKVRRYSLENILSLGYVYCDYSLMCQFVLDPKHRHGTTVLKPKTALYWVYTGANRKCFEWRKNSDHKRSKWIVQEPT